MIKSLLPNCRFVSVVSDHGGKDWPECSQLIDQNLEKLGMDLAEESVYLRFDSAPGALLAGDGVCSVARSVIGPKKILEAPFLLTDWVQATVFRKVLKAHDWSGMLEEAYGEWESLQRQGQKLAPHFMILAKRRLLPELNLSLEVIFYGP